MARPMGTEHAMGVSVWPPRAFKVMRDDAGSERYLSFRGFCTDFKSISTSASSSPLEPTIPEQQRTHLFQANPLANIAPKSGGHDMPKCLIEREIPGIGSMTDAQIREASRKSVAVLKELGPEIQWLQSYVTGDKLYCVYLAPDETLIREHA